MASKLKGFFDEIAKAWFALVGKPTSEEQEKAAAFVSQYWKDYIDLSPEQKADVWHHLTGEETATEGEEKTRDWVAKTRHALTSSGAPEVIIEAFDSILEAKWPLGIIGAFGTWLLWELTRAGAMAKVLGIEAAFSVAREVQPGRPDPMTAWLMHFRCDVPRETILDWLHDLGWSTKIIDDYRKLAETLIGVGEIVDLTRRGDYTIVDFRNALYKQGFSREDTASLEKLLPRLPGPGDLVTFALREVWRPDLRGELLTPDAPGRYYDLMAKQGFAREFAEDYWASHWVLPAVRQGFEMFWRIPEFGEGDLRALLTRLDILPRYHDNLMAIAYAPWTRVDIRRMHKVGTIPDRAGLERAYGDIGYHGKQLEGIVDFTIAYNAEEERDFTRTDIIAAYDIGRFNRAEALSALVSIGYTEILADVWLAKQDLAKANRYADERIAQVRTLYRGKRLTRTEAHNQLTSIPIPAAEADNYLELWDVGREALVGRPSKSELRRFFLQNILEESEFRSELAGHHLSATYIDWYVDDAKIHLLEAMHKEQERVQKEEERVRKSRVTTDRDKLLAHLDVLIAEANVSIADIKLSMIAELPDETLVLAEQLIGSFKVLIAQLREQKALTRVGYYTELQTERRPPRK